MRPIRLEIAGLQSYREPQAVDFDSLCQGGVFGIFGPTGSGKSSILDAMTLALYGKVERAVKGTQGILNGAENKLSVSFTFELSGGGEKERYRVERQYKRGGENSVHGSICRLVRVRPDGETVLADKQNEVDAGVEGLIGLAMADFTRAVVLPQGKFAEFLSLTGKDRRQMLQRLFRLERYGDALAAKLSQRGDRTKLALKEKEAEQQGLGDASPETLLEASRRLAEAEEKAETLKKALAEAETRHAELSRRRDRQQELRRVEERLAALKERADEMALKERRLDSLVRAAAVLPALRDADEAETVAAASRAGKEEARLALDARTAEAERAAGEWSLLREETERREPELLIRLERLEQALQLEKEAAELSAQRDRLSGELERLEKERALLAAELAEQEGLLARGRAKQAAIKEQLASLSPAAERHARLQSAVSRAEQLTAMLAQVAETGKEHAETVERTQAADRQLAGCLRTTEDAAAQGRSLYAWRKELDRETERFREEAGRLSAESSEAAERARMEETERERLQLAHLLAERLEEGQPCPVCGSCAHPSLAAGPEKRDAVESSGGRRAELEERARRLARLEQEAGHAADRSGWYGKRLEERLGALAAVGGENGSFHAEAAPAAAWTDGVDAHAQGPAIEAFAGWWEGLQQRLGELAARQDSWEALWSEAGQAAAQARDSAAVSAAAAEQAGARLRKLEDQAAALAKAWSADFPEWSPESIRAAADEAAAADTEVRDLRARLDKSVGFLEELERKHREMERRVHEISLHETEAKARKETADAAVQAALSRLRQWTDGESAARLTAQAKEELSRLRTAAQEAKNRSESSERGRAEAQRVLDAAAERGHAAELARERSSSRLAEALSAYGFGEPEQVRLLLPHLDESSKLKAEIEEYRQAETQLAAQIRLLRESLTGEPVPEEEWERSRHFAESVKAETEEALSALGKARRDADDLSSRRQRWQELEEARLALASEAARIGQLQAVFRGNAFVEYVAEEQLEQVCLAASERLGFLTRRRYALEVDSGGGFVIRDDANGGLRRPVSSLSGGETFLTSLAMALALSAQIQLRGKYPLQFFFLDEGFGTLDPELLDTVVTSLEKLQHSSLAVGVISHVPELQSRLPRRLHVVPAEPGGRGSRITYETM